MGSPEFDRYSPAYEDLLKDPLRDRFTGNESLFFHQRKCELIRRFFRRRRVSTSALNYLDVGCGKGELLSLLREDFARSAGCDVSAAMMEGIEGVDARLQTDPLRIPFDDAEFDLVTAVCVYHHLPVASRALLTADVFRVLKPGGVFCMIEHNPVNPVTRTIVARTPVDQDAILLPAGEARVLATQAGLFHSATTYFLYFPKNLYRIVGWAESWLTKIPLGGQYAIFARK